jgi:hypothetical protein
MTSDRKTLVSLRDPIRGVHAAPRRQAGRSASRMTAGRSASAVSALREALPADAAAPEASRRRASTVQRSRGDS